MAGHKHSQALSAITGLSYAQAHRKLNSSAAWTLEELSRVAEHFGETLAELLEAAADDVSHAARLSIGTVRMPCQIWIGEPVGSTPAAPLVAMQAQGGWLVVPSSEATSSAAREVRRLVARPASEPLKRVAVLDADPASADGLAAQLAVNGLRTQAFHAVDELMEAEASQRFDGYVLDWRLGGGGGTARALIRSIRERDAQCPIVVFGELGSQLADERDVADALTTYGLMFHEKPVRAVIVAADLARAFAESRYSGT